MRRGPKDDLDLMLLTMLAGTMQGLRQHVVPLFAADGLTGGQFDTLKVLHQFGPLAMSDLLRKTLTTSGNIDVVLNNLLRKGMITKTPDPGDGRRRIIALTAKGRAYIDKRFPAHVRELHTVLGVLSASEKRQLQGLLGRLGSGLNAQGGSRGIVQQGP